MQNLIYSSLALLFLLMTSCSEDIETDTGVDFISEDSNEASYQLKDADVMSVEKLQEVDLYLPDLKSAAKNESFKSGSTEVIFQSTYHLDEGRAVELKGSINNLPDPFKQKLVVTVTPDQGDPDLYLYVKKPEFRNIRKSELYGNEIDRISLRSTDFNIGEESFFLRIYAYRSTRFEITITIENVDCIEYEPAPNRYYSAIGQSTVCGCDNKEYYNSNAAIQAGITAWSEGSCYSKNCPDPHKIIGYIKEHNQCDDNPYTLYKVNYKGKPAYFLDGVTHFDLVDAASDLIYDCEGRIIASNGYVTEDFVLDYDEISEKEWLFECESECSDLEEVVHSLKNTYSSWCTSGNKCQVKIYSALYKNLPAVYVQLQCSDLYDVGGGVYNCKGDLIAGASYGSSPSLNLDQLELIELKWDCTDSHSCYEITEDFENYNTHSKITSQSNHWTTWNSSDEGSHKDANIYISNSGKKMLMISKPKVQDMIYKLGNMSSGKYELSFEMWNSGAGYFNIQANQNNRVSSGVLGVHFGRNGYGKVTTNGGGTANFHHANGEWINIKIEADFDHEKFVLRIGSKKWNLTSVRGLSFGAINFYAVDFAKFFVDNIRLKEICN